MLEAPALYLFKLQQEKKTPVLTMNKIELVRRLAKEVALDTLLLYTLAGLHNAIQ